MRTDSFKFCVKGAFPFRDEVHSLAGRASSVFDIAEKFPGCEAVRLNTDNLPAEVIGECIAVDGHFFYPSRLKGYDGFLVMRDRLKMPGLAVTGKLLGAMGDSAVEQESGSQKSDYGAMELRLYGTSISHKESIS